MNTDNRTLNLCKALGWQGGTIHQVAKATGVDTGTLLYGKPSSESTASDYSLGWFAARTCSFEYNRDHNFRAFHGVADFWLGVAEGFNGY